MDCRSRKESLVTHQHCKRFFRFTNFFVIKADLVMIPIAKAMELTARFNRKPKAYPLIILTEYVSCSILYIARYISKKGGNTWKPQKFL